MLTEQLLEGHSACYLVRPDWDVFRLMRKGSAPGGLAPDDVQGTKRSVRPGRACRSIRRHTQGAHPSCPIGAPAGDAPPPVLARVRQTHKLDFIATVVAREWA